MQPLDPPHGGAVNQLAVVCMLEGGGGLECERLPSALLQQPSELFLIAARPQEPALGAAHAVACAAHPEVNKGACGGRAAREYDARVEVWDARHHLLPRPVVVIQTHLEFGGRSLHPWTWVATQRHVHIEEERVKSKAQHLQQHSGLEGNRLRV